MNAASVLFRIVAALFRVSSGLLLHPYQTMQTLVDDTWLVWVTLLPSAVLAVVTVLWRILVVPLLGLLFPCSSVPLHLCSTLPLLGNILTFFCIYWQMILLYLLFRFSTAFRDSAK